MGTQVQRGVLQLIGGEQDAGPPGLTPGPHRSHHTCRPPRLRVCGPSHLASWLGRAHRLGLQPCTGPRAQSTLCFHAPKDTEIPRTRGCQSEQGVRGLRAWQNLGVCRQNQTGKKSALRTSGNVEDMEIFPSFKKKILKSIFMIGNSNEKRISTPTVRNRSIGTDLGEETRASYKH